MTANDPTSWMSGQVRFFVQEQGNSPTYPYLYYGCLSLGGLQEELGEGTPVYCPSSEVRNQWDIVDEVPSQPGLPTTDFTNRANRFLTDIWWALRKRNCRMNMVAVIGNCQNPSDIDQFDAKILMFGTRMTAFNLPEMNALSGENNAPLDITGSLQMLGFDRFLRMQFGEVADATVLSEALDGIFADSAQCGDCGSPSDGCQKQYVLTVSNSGSPGLSSQLAYTKNDWSTSAVLDINTLGGLSGNRLANVGTRIVVISQATNSHHHKTISSIDAGTPGWTAVSSGYVATKGPRAIFSKSPSRTYIAAAGGYIYLMTNPLAAVTPITDGSVSTQDLNDIHGFSRTIVAVGNSNAVLVSSNDGSTFALKTGPLPGINLNAVYLVSERTWWVGTANGKLYFTDDAGSIWVNATPESDLTAINDIQFVDGIVGYFVAQAGATARAYRTSDNGYSWHRDEPYLADLPTAERYNFIVPCDGNYNKVLTGGRISSGGDGIVVVGE